MKFDFCTAGKSSLLVEREKSKFIQKYTTEKKIKKNS